MRFEILGRLRVVDGDGSSTPSAHKVGILLTALLIRANQVVSTSQLIGEIWGQDPPRRATAALHVYVSQLRKFLKRPGEDGVIVTRPPGYMLQIPCGDLDLNTFRRLLYQGRNQIREQRYGAAVTSLQTAAELVRDEEIVGSGPIVGGFTSWLAEVRLECAEMRIESSLALGRHRELVSVLQTLISEHPLHEAFYRQLMLALYRSDRRADALQVYQGVRSMLDAELALEPCASLRDLHRAILLADERLQLRAAG
ncbi:MULTISPECIES: AfsR/SARP family transcriptional regulator [Streptomyces]|uniref:AfsR/SARP family transcriptional regulator n=1 Tax=Streptomyces TaxID=1883 RepID=UPI0004CF533B|nr:MULTISPECIES: AfsR/SARP family transcriptional regulator [Streptomyces]TFI22096.1 AfsR/SARP family transcriptional regulator [Streptomyces sp. 4R-3d]